VFCPRCLTKKAPPNQENWQSLPEPVLTPNSSNDPSRDSEAVRPARLRVPGNTNPVDPHNMTPSVELVSPPADMRHPRPANNSPSIIHPPLDHEPTDPELTPPPAAPNPPAPFESLPPPAPRVASTQNLAVAKALQARDPPALHNPQQAPILAPARLSAFYGATPSASSGTDFGATPGVISHPPPLLLSKNRLLPPDASDQYGRLKRKSSDSVVIKRDVSGHQNKERKKKRRSSSRHSSDSLVLSKSTPNASPKPPIIHEHAESVVVPLPYTGGQWKPRQPPYRSNTDPDRIRNTMQGDGLLRREPATRAHSCGAIQTPNTLYEHEQDPESNREYLDRAYLDHDLDFQRQISINSNNSAKRLMSYDENSVQSVRTFETSGTTLYSDSGDFSMRGSSPQQQTAFWASYIPGTPPSTTQENSAQAQEEFGGLSDSRSFVKDERDSNSAKGHRRRKTSIHIDLRSEGDLFRDSTWGKPPLLSEADKRGIAELLGMAGALTQSSPEPLSDPFANAEPPERPPLPLPMPERGSSPLGSKEGGIPPLGQFPSNSTYQSAESIGRHDSVIVVCAAANPLAFVVPD